MKKSVASLLVPVLIGACIANQATAAGPASGASTRAVIASTAAAAATDPATQLMEFAQQHYPTYFPSNPPTQTVSTWVYRYYPDTGSYLIIDGEKVLVAGPLFGNGIIYVGLVSQFVGSNSQPKITAKQLSACPDGIIQAADFYKCMTGQLSGAQVFDTSAACALSIKSDGTLQLSSGATVFSIPLPYGSALFSKSSSNGTLRITVNSDFTASVVNSLRFTADSNNDFFVQGGVLQVDGTSTPTGKSLSCRFAVTAG